MSDPRRRPSAAAAAAVLVLPLALAGCADGGFNPFGGGTAQPAAPGDVLARSQAPAYAVEDTWVYAVDGEQVVEKVIDVTDDGTIRWAATDGRRWEAWADPLLPPVRSLPEAGARTVTSFTPSTLGETTLFPLERGKAVRYRAEIASAQDGRIERTTEHECEVRGPREITVPAGTYTAVEVFCRRGGRFETLYYVPEVRNTVMELRDAEGRMERKELVAFRPAASDTPPAAAEAAPLPGDPVPQTAPVEVENLVMPPPVSDAGAIPEAAAAPAVASAAPAAASGAWTLQLGAMSTEAAARSAWAQWAPRAQGVLGGVEGRVMEADGLWRVTAGRYASRAEAARACDRLKGGGLQCLPRSF